MAHVLVTGAAGFIGRRIVDALLDRGDTVSAYDALVPSVHPSRAFPPYSGAVQTVSADVRDADALAGALAGVDVVCHQAAKVGLGLDLADAPDYTSHNVLGTATLLAAMAGAQVHRLVLASSMVVYGEGAYSCAEHGAVRPGPRSEGALRAGSFDPPCPDCGRALAPELVTEDAPMDPRNVYATTKLAQEHLAASWARSTGGRVAALRYHNVYGPHMPKDTPYAGVASIFRSAYERGAVPRVFEDGGQRRDFVHVRDIAAANVAALDWTADTAHVAVRPFNVGSGVVHTVGDMATALAVEFRGDDPVVTGEFRLGDVRHITASSARANDELGYSATVGFTDGMAEFAHAPLRR